VGYRGYYDRAEADALAAHAACARAGGQRLRRAGLLHAGLARTGSGGDPLLNTFIGWPEGELARLIFHELAHQVVYAKPTTPCSTSRSPRRWNAWACGAGWPHGSDAARRQYARTSTRGERTSAR
jgi:predicted aminopeptidase